MIPTRTATAAHRLVRLGHLPAAGILTDPTVTGPCDAGCCDGVTLFIDTRDGDAVYCATHAKIIAMARLFV